MESASVENPPFAGGQSEMIDAHATGGRRNTVARPESLVRWRGALIGLALAVVVVLIGTGIWHRFSGQSSEAPGATGEVAAPVAVTVQTIWQHKQRLWNDFSGRLRAVDSAEIRPEVSGRITEVRFQDGQSVKVGDILMVIDPRLYEAAVARAQARIIAARATLQLTSSNEIRDTSLLRTKAISQREFDQTDSANNAASAELLTAEADLKTAQVSVDHAYVKAPIAGRISRAELTVGNLVQDGAGAPLLTSIVSEDGIYADFEVDEQTYLQTIRDAASGNAQESQIPVELVLQGDAGQTYRGFVQNFDNRIDEHSGTIRARARFANTEGKLVPGMFVSVRLAGSRERNLMMIPDRAIGFDQSKKFVFVVSAENKVAYREVELGRELAGERVVQKGLAPGERVIVDGVQRVRPDARVIPKEVNSAAILPAQTAQAAEATAPTEESR